MVNLNKNLERQLVLWAVNYLCVGKKPRGEFVGTLCPLETEILLYLSYFALFTCCLHSCHLFFLPQPGLLMGHHAPEVGMRALKPAC